jgi:adenylate cyclase
MNNKEKIITIAVCWTLAGGFISIYDHIAGFSGQTTGDSFIANLLINVLVGFAAAMTGGVFLVNYVNEHFSHIPYWKSIVLVVGSFVVVSSTLIVVVSTVMAAILTHGEISWTVWTKCLSDPMHIKNMLIWSVVVAATQLMLQIDNKFGQGVLFNLIIGKYHRPREEKRIFMIVDLNASTTMAETLPQEQYHMLLRDFFSDMTKPILINLGEIYQYVGDGLVISWQINNDRIGNHCLQCYFDMQDVLVRQRERYFSRYGICPNFKAGLHYGSVVAGEIGVIKKDITYSGDVLNTVSRIQGKCNDYRVDILTSDELLSLLPYEKEFTRIPLGEVELKGKQKKVCVSTMAIMNA